MKSSALNYESLFAPEGHVPILYFSSLRVLQPDNFVLPFRTFNTHSLIEFTNSLLQLVIRVLRNLGLAF